MKRRRDTRRTHHGTLVALLLVATLGLLLPGALTGKLINLVQVIVPFQDWTTRSANASADTVFGESDVPTTDDALRLKRENAALRHRLTTLSAEHEQLATDFAAAAGIRRQGLTSGRLIPARVVAADAVPWRESRLVSAGALSGVRPKAAVTTDHFAVAADDPAAVRDGHAVLAGEVLVGFVEQVGTHTARVRLLTDRQTKLKVLIARLKDDRYHPLDAEFWLVGIGNSSLEVRDVNHRFIRADAIKAGDVVLTVPGDPALPAALTVGVITAIQPDMDNPLLYRLTVEPAAKPHDLRSVFVVDLLGPGPI